MLHKALYVLINFTEQRKQKPVCLLCCLKLKNALIILRNRHYNLRGRFIIEKVRETHIIVFSMLCTPTFLQFQLMNFHECFIFSSHPVSVISSIAVN